MMRKSILACLLCGFTVCWMPAAENPHASLVKAVAEHNALQGESLEYFLRLTPPLIQYLDHASGGKLMKSLADVYSVSELKRILDLEIGPDWIDFGEKMFDFFTPSNSKEKPGETRRVETAHFIFSFLAGSKAEQDIDFLAANAEKSLAAIAATIGVSLEAPLRFLKNSGEAGQDKRKIAVFLHGNKQAMQKRTKSKGLGITNFGATIDDEQYARLTCEIHVVYTNPFALAIVAHEVAHAALLLGSFKLEAIQGKKIEGQKGLAEAFFAGFRRIPAFLQEGIGDHAVYYQGFLGKWPLLPGISQQLRPIIGSGSYIPLRQLIDAHPAIVVKKHKYFSLQAASFIDFLIREYGVGKMRAWLLAGNEKGGDTFASVYGEDLSAVEKKWLASLT